MIAKILSKLEPGQETWNDNGNLPFSFDMTDSDNGYPCTHLTELGCDIYETKPAVCDAFPEKEDNLRHSDCSCSFSFDEYGERAGTCDKCEP